MKLTIVYITARQHPKFEWFVDSLGLQIGSSDEITVIKVDSLLEMPSTQTIIATNGGRMEILSVLPKPSVWTGKYRLTKQDWWDISGARNTGICLCKTEWVSFCDDRCVLAPTWLQAVRDAMAGGYAVSGSYEKRSGMKVENGVITEPGTVIGTDPRNPKGYMGEAEQTFGDGWYGCTSALPLEWCLEMNGWPEMCSSLGLEDVVFGNQLVMNNHITQFAARMKIIEDRTPEACQNMPLRTDKDRHLEPRDKSHILLERCGGRKRSENVFEIRDLRNKALAGEPLPIPTEPTRDWFDGELLSEMYVR